MSARKPDSIIAAKQMMKEHESTIVALKSAATTVGGIVDSVAARVERVKSLEAAIRFAEMKLSYELAELCEHSEQLRTKTSFVREIAPRLMAMHERVLEQGLASTGQERELLLDRAEKYQDAVNQLLANYLGQA